MPHAANLKHSTLHGQESPVGWFAKLEHRLSSFVHEVGQDLEKLGTEIAHVGRDVLKAGEAAISAVVEAAPQIIEGALHDTYEDLVGNDIKVLRDPHASKAQKAGAALDLATTFAVPADKIPALIGEKALKNFISEGEKTAIPAALKSLQQSGDVAALVGVEAALLAVDPKAKNVLTAAGVDLKDAQEVLAEIRDAVKQGKDLSAQTKLAIGELATAIAGPGSLETRVAALEAAYGPLSTASNDLTTLGKDATAVKTALGPVAPPAATLASPTVATNADLVRETLEKLSPDTVQRIQKSGAAEVGMPHADAVPWNGKAQTGSVTSVIGSRVEQFTGKGWTTYDTAQLAPLQAQLAANAASQDPTLLTKISPGDELRMGASGSIDLVPHDKLHPELKSISVDAIGRSQNLEVAAGLQRS